MPSKELGRLMLLQEGAAPEEQQHWSTTSIHRLSRVPVHLRDKNSKDYTPVFVAIDPLHYPRLRWGPAQRLKVSYLKSLISRGHPDWANGLVVAYYAGAVAAREKEARAMYVREDVAADIDPFEFIQIMVLDGCFILEHLVKVRMGHEEPSLARQLSVDLILAENQLPFFVLVDLIARTKLPELENLGYAPSVLLVKLVLFFLAGEKGRDLSDDALPAADGVSHILHLLHEMITKARTMWEAPPSRVLEGGRAQAARRLLRRLPSLLAVPLLRRILPECPRRRALLRECVASASDMKRMGLQFKNDAARGPASSAAAVARFPDGAAAAEPDGVRAVVTGGGPQDVSSYVAFMAKLVRSAEDARLLAEEQVVQQQLGGLGNESMEEMARFFRVVGAASEAPDVLYSSYLSDTLDLLKVWTYNWVDVERNYFTFLAEILALATFVSSVATIIQTYAAFKYH